MFLTAGAKLDKYEIVAPLAVGGMAELYVARSRGIEGFEKLVVLKRILPQHARDEEFVQMFLDEARLAATLHHPNVVQVYDIGVIEGRYYFTMEFVHGQDLAAMVATARTKGKGLKLEHSISIIAGAAAGLHHAHEQKGSDGKPLGIVHRDVSPTNILVSYDGHVKVVDFGIAKAAARRTVTTAGGAKGKLSYMSPEQVRADRTLDRRSDVFSLAIVLYELTTGTPLFRGDSDLIIAEKIIDGRVKPPREIRANYPEVLEQIVMKGLAKDREQRFATAREFQLALDDWSRAAQLRHSSVGLGELMASLFPDQTSAWQRASSHGESLVDHVTNVLATSRTTMPRAANRSRWISVIALVAIGAAIAGWALVLAKRDRSESTTRPVDAASVTQPVATPTPLPVTPSIDAMEPPVLADAAVDASPPIDAGTKPHRKPKIDAGVSEPSNEPRPDARDNNLDDRLNPFKPPDGTP